MMIVWLLLVLCMGLCCTYVHKIHHFAKGDFGKLYVHYNLDAVSFARNGPFKTVSTSLRDPKSILKRVCA